MKKEFRDPADRLIDGTAILVVLLALLVLAGWLLDVTRLRTIAPMWWAMAPLTAVLLILLAASTVWLQRRRTWANIAMIACSLIAGAVLAEYLFDVSLGLQALTAVLDRSSGVRLAELPAPDTSAAVLMLVLALLCYRTKHTRLHDFADVVVVVIGLVCLQVLLAYGYNIVTTMSWRGFRQIAPHSTLSMMVLAFAATARRPTLGLYGAMRTNAQSAVQLRRLLPTMVLVCIVIGCLYVLAVRERVATTPELAAWTVIGTVVILALLLFVTSADMRHAEAIVQRRQEELLAAKTEAEAASETKSRFMAVMSHELRTPLTAMIGYADLLSAGVTGEPDEETRNYLQRISASGWHLVGLIDAVLMYAGGKTPADEMRRERVDVANLARAAAQLFEPQAAAKSLMLHVDTAGPAWVSTDPRKLREMLINLLSNAVKFTAHGGIELRVHRNADTVVIDVADTGIGISPAHMEHVWEPFQLVDASHTRTQSGMGLGLALTRQLAEQLDARVAARSNPGRGTTFTIELAAAEPREADSLQLNGVRVLVVDDESSVLRIMARTLTRYGAQVTPAESAQQALDCIDEQGSFDIVVTDISMPEMTGIELAKHLEARPPMSPVLFVSGAELNPEHHSEIARLNARLLRKPFDMVELAKVVHQLAGGKA